MASPNQLDLGAFLSDQVAQGQVDSRGEFTVSHTQAARKLARFALPRNTAWVSKLVQAANRWKCSILEIRQSRSESMFHFSLARASDIPTEDAIVSRLLSGKVGGPDALDAFCTALRALVEQARLSFILVADDGDLTPRPIYAGEYYASLSEKARLHKRFNPKPGLSLTVYHRPPARDEDSFTESLSRLRSYLPIIEELDCFNYVSHVPILLDGRRVDSLVSGRGLGLTPTCRPLAFLGVQGLSCSPARLALPEDFEEKIVSLLSHPRRVARDYGGSKDFQAVFVLSAVVEQGWIDLLGPRRRARLLWVQDGVVAQEEPLELKTTAVGLSVFANAEGLDTDLTGLGLLQTGPYRSRRAELLGAVAAALGNDRVRKTDFFRPDHDAQSAADLDWDKQEEVRERIKVLLKGTGTGLTLSLFNPVLGVPTTVAAVGYAFTRKPRATEERLLASQPALQETIAKELSQISEFLSAQGSRSPAPDSI